MQDATKDITGYLSAASFWSPVDLPPSDWIEHAPFASWLVAAMAPSRVVDLSLTDGDGDLGFPYAVLCEAIHRLGTQTPASGVRPWASDGAHRAAVARNAPYAGFSSLIRATPDEARARFAPGSVDLLHVGGARDHAEAAHVIETWRPLLGDAGVVLLHGTGTEDRRTGVGLLFEHLRSHRPALDFPDGRGLGVLALGRAIPEGLEVLFGDGAERVRAAYAALGEALRLRRRAAADGQALALVVERARSGGRAAGGPDLPPDCNADIARVSAALSGERSADLSELDRRLSALEAGAGARPAAPEDLQSGSGTPPGATATAPHIELDRLRAASRAVRSRRSAVERQAEDLAREAEVARGEVTRLAEAAWKRLEGEHAADQGRAEARRRLEDLLRHEHEAGSPPGGLRDVISLGAARRWRRAMRDRAALVARVEEATARMREADERYAEAREARRSGERLAHAAQPRASELESAIVMLRGELAAVEEIAAVLPDVLGASNIAEAGSYVRWVALHDTLTAADRRAIRARLRRLRRRPLISVVMPVYNPPVRFLRDAVASVQSQLYPDWELCIADDASPDPAVRDALCEMAGADPRIRLVMRPHNGHISAASNSALALAAGEFVALMDHDDLLPDHALFEVAAALDQNPNLDVIYSDEDHIDAHGRRNTPYFKPDFNPDLLLGQNLVSHLGVYRRSLLERIGGFRLGFEGSQDYDLALRAVDASAPERVHHIPAVLYHWRSDTGADTFSEASLQRCIAAARRAIADHLERRGHAGEVVEHPVLPSWQRVRRPRPEPAPLVSVIVPTRDKAELLGPCVDGLLNRTRYPAIEVLVVDHQSSEPATLALLAELARDPRVRVLPHEGPFNYSAINNNAVQQARGSVLALLNNDVDVIAPDWLDEMVALAVLPEVGAVGAKLLYPDDRVQHAGVILGSNGVAGHFFHRVAAEDPSYFGRAALTATVAAVTAACLVVRRSVFEEAGGFDADNLPVAFNDVDLCLEIRARGYRNVWTPHALLYHHESVSRGSDLDGERRDRFQREVEFMQHKWGAVLDHDPFYNPNLDLDAADFSFAFPPRRTKPWTTNETRPKP